MSRTCFVALLWLAACGASAGVEQGFTDTGDAPQTDAGRADASERDAWTDVDVDAAEAGAGDADAGVACGPPTPFGQLACFGHPDAGRAGTSHGDGCDAGDAGNCYELQPHLWCCPE